MEKITIIPDMMVDGKPIINGHLYSDQNVEREKFYSHLLDREIRAFEKIISIFREYEISVAVNQPHMFADSERRSFPDRTFIHSMHTYNRPEDYHAAIHEIYRIYGNVKRSSENRPTGHSSLETKLEIDNVAFGIGHIWGFKYLSSQIAEYNGKALTYYLPVERHFNTPYPSYVILEKCDLLPEGQILYRLSDSKSLVLRDFGHRQMCTQWEERKHNLKEFKSFRNHMISTLLRHT